MKPNPAIALNKELFKAFCEKHSIAKVVLEYDGCGDSGQFETCTAYNEKGDEVDIPAEPCKMYVNQQRWDFSGAGAAFYWTEPEEENCSDAESLIETLGYMALEDHYGGWEINSGSYGTVTLFADGSGLIEHNERIEEVKFDEQVF